MEPVANHFNCHALAELQEALHQTRSITNFPHFNNCTFSAVISSAAQSIEQAIGRPEEFEAIRCAIVPHAVAHESSALHSHLSVAAYKGVRDRLAKAIIAAGEAAREAPVPHQNALQVNMILAARTLSSMNLDRQPRRLCVDEECGRISSEYVRLAVLELDRRLAKFEPSPTFLKDYPKVVVNPDQPHARRLGYANPAHYQQLDAFVKSLPAQHLSGAGHIVGLLELVKQVEVLTHDVKTAIRADQQRGQRYQTFAGSMVLSITSSYDPAYMAARAIEHRFNSEFAEFHGRTVLIVSSPLLESALENVVKALKESGRIHIVNPSLARFGRLVRLRADTVVSEAIDVLKESALPRWNFQPKNLKETLESVLALARGDAATLPSSGNGFNDRCPLKPHKSS